MLCILLASSTSSTTTWISPFYEASALSGTIYLIDLLLFLEIICFIEVGRIALGQLKGNLALGVVLHAIRMSCLLIVLPGGFGGKVGSNQLSNQDLIGRLVLYSWALTEVGRYPMYIFPTSSKARFVRMVLPIVTFPLGAFAEAVGAYRVFMELTANSEEMDGQRLLKMGLLGMVISVNSILGPTLAYPALLKKGVPVLLGKAGSKDGKSKKYT